MDVETLEEAEQKVDEVLRAVIADNKELVELLGARAIQGKAYLPGSEDDINPSKTDRRYFLAGGAALLATALAGRAGALAAPTNRKMKTTIRNWSCAVCAAPNMSMVALAAFTSGKAAARMR